MYPKDQCSGSMTFWCESGSADPCLELMNPDSDPDADPDPSIFITYLQDANKKTNLKKKKISCILLYFFKVLIHHFQR